jgi:two-component system LytT family response regulator
MTIKTAIITNDEHCAEDLHYLIQHAFPSAVQCGIANNIDDAVNLLSNEDPQIIFADTRLLNGSSFEFLRRLTMRELELVFLTDCDAYEPMTLQYPSSQFLIKPIARIEFEEVLDHIKKRLSLKTPEPNFEWLMENISQLGREQCRKISIPTLNGFDFVDLHDILWCGSEGMYTVFHLTDRSRIISSRNIGSYEVMLGNNNFFRIHHSVIINMRWIKKYTKGKGGSVILSDGTELEVSQRRKSEFLDKFLM